MPVLELTTTANDDGMENNATGAIDRTSTAISFGNNAYAANVLLRFALPSAGWLAGKTITGMSLTFTVNGGSLSNSFKQKIYLELKKNPAQLTTTASDISNRTKASTSPNGDQFGGSVLTNWNAGTTVTYSSTSISTLLALYEAFLIDAAAAGTPFGVADIDALCFIFKWDSSGSNGERVFNGSEFGSGAPKLTITYAEPNVNWDRTVRILRTSERKAVV